MLVEFAAGHIYGNLLCNPLLVRGKQVELLLEDIVYTLESQSLADGP